MADLYTLFVRVTPEQKRLLVLALQSAGHTVGMTGDGVNDVLALKEADCSVAMASGCDAAAQVSQLVLPLWITSSSFTVLLIFLRPRFPLRWPFGGACCGALPSAIHGGAEQSIFDRY